MLTRVCAAAFVLFAAPFVIAPAYTFPEPRPFSGPAFWNPYAHLSGSWRRANLHAHGRAWIGLTNGHQSDAAVIDVYRRHGYDIAGISDYQRIAAYHGADTLPLYEHGYNIAKAHQLAIGAWRVEWLDFPLWQTLSQKQFLINRVARTAALLAINHPNTAYADADLERLTGYQLMEVLNGPFVYESSWDAALSSGHVVWAIGDDDNHDVTYAPRFGVACSMIDAPSTRAPDVLTSLRDGRVFAMSLRSQTPEAWLSSVDVHDTRLTVSIAGAPATFQFIGPHGIVRQMSTDTVSATYTIGRDDAYVRTVIRTPQTVMYLNPIVRYDGVRLPMPASAIDLPITWARRTLLLLAGIVGLWWLATR
ncbi:MAG TPA: hypothetical protein VLV86_25865 [Vicinamibacterales bacterium]|nr:hypothetical protein [Vicinamibacterales bacterium]